MRRVIRAAWLGLDPGDLSSLDDPTTLEAIRRDRGRRRASRTVSRLAQWSGGGDTFADERDSPARARHRHLGGPRRARRRARRPARRTAVRCACWRSRAAGSCRPGCSPTGCGIRNILVAAVEYYDDHGQPGPTPTFLQFPADPLLRGQRVLDRRRGLGQRHDDPRRHRARPPGGRRPDDGRPPLQAGPFGRPGRPDVHAVETDAGSSIHSRPAVTGSSTDRPAESAARRSSEAHPSGDPMTRCAAPRRHAKGAFILESDADRRDWSLRGPAVRGLADPRPDRRAMAVVRSSRPADRRGTGPPSGGATTAGRPGRTRRRDDIRRWRGGPPIPTVWSLATGPDGAIFAGVEPAGLFRSDDGGATWSHVEGLTNHPSRAHLAAGCRRPDPAHDRPPPHGPAADVGRHLGRRRVRDEGRRRDLGAAQQRRPRGLHPEPLSRDGPVRPQVRDGGGRARDAVPAEPLRRCTARPTAARPGPSYRQRPAEPVRLRAGRPIRATPKTFWVIPLNATRARAASCPRRAPRSGARRSRRHVGPPGRRAAPGATRT